MLILGVDPGPTRSGWALVDTATPRKGTVQFLFAGHAELSSGIGLVRSDVIAIERPRWFARDINPAHVVDTAYVAGYLAGRHPGAVELAAQDWKRKLGLRPNANDAAVRSVVERFVVGLPKRTNVHVRDALGIALAVAWMRQ